MFWKNFKSNKGAVLGFFTIFFFLFIGLLAPWLAPYDPTRIHAGDFGLPPAFVDGGKLSFLLGTDDLGRDLLSRLIYGARLSMGIGGAVVVLSASLGALLGLVSGYLGGGVDFAIMRGVDVLMAFPSVLLAIVVVSVLGPGIINVIVAVSIVAVPGFIRIVRASVMIEREKEYVVASRGFGGHPIRIMFYGIFPNCLAPLIVQITLGFSDGILNAAALGFLVSGYLGGGVDFAIMRGVDVLMAFPSVLLAIVVVSVLGPGIINVIVAVSIVSTGCPRMVLLELSVPVL